MAKLCDVTEGETTTNWLEALQPYDCIRDENHPADFAPSGRTTLPCEICRGCPQRNTTGHHTVASERFTAEVPAVQRIQLKTLATFQYLLHKLEQCAHEMEGSQTGYLLNGYSGANNFADSTTFEVVSVSGSTLSIKLAAGGDVRNAMIGGTPPSPGDIVVPEYPSCMCYKVNAAIVKATGYADGVLTVELDMAIDAMCHSADETNPDPATYYVKIWRQHADPEKWDELIPLTARPMKRSGKTFAYETLRDGDGVVRLHDGRTAWSVTSAYRVQDGVREDITSSVQASGRLAMLPIDGEIVANLYLGAVDANGMETLSPLYDGDTASISVTYYAEHAGGRCYPNSSRCMYCKVDPSNSDYGQTVGSAVDGDGVTWYCSQRRVTYYDAELEEWVTSSPSGIADFRPECPLVGYCDKFVSLDDARPGIGGWTVYSDMAHILRQIWCANNISIAQGMPGVSNHRNFRVYRDGNPSLRQLHGGPTLTSPTGYHETRVAVGAEGAYVADFATTTDINGDTTLTPKYGLLYDASATPAYGSITPAGTASALWYADGRVDPYGNTYDDVSDPDGVYRQGFYRAGYRITKDTHAASGMARHEQQQLLDADEIVIMPGLDLTVIDTVQVPGGLQVDATVYSAQVVVDGVTCLALIQIYPPTLIDHLDQRKAPNMSVVSGTVSDCAEGDGYYEMELLNETNYWSYNIPQADVVIGYKCGGHFVRPHDTMMPNSFYAVGNSRGGADYCQPGDAILFTGEGLPAGMAGRLFPVVHAQAYGGTQAADWGADIRIQRAVVTGYLEISADLAIGAYIAPLDTVEIEDHTTHAAYTRLTGDRPSTDLGAGNFWVDTTTNRIVFAATNVGDHVDITYTGEGITGTFTLSDQEIPTSIFNTDMAYADYNPPDSVTIGGVTLERVVGGLVGVGQYSTSDVGGDLVLNFHPTAAARIALVTHSVSSAAPAPPDVCDMPEFGTGVEYGRNQDMVRMLDVDGLLAGNYASLAGLTATCVRGALVSLSANAIVEIAPYGTDAWTTLTAGVDYVHQYEIGKLWLAYSRVIAMAAITSVWCVRVR